MSSQEFYWQLSFGDFKNPSTLMIPPSEVTKVKERWDKKLPIHTSAGSIPASNIRGFEMSNKVFRDQKLLEDAVRAFREPEYNADDSLIVDWVKITVPLPIYQKRYQTIPAYWMLGNDGSQVTVAFRLPTYLIDVSRQEYCTAEEITTLTRLTS
jgi:hypothetical protein